MPPSALVRRADHLPGLLIYHELRLERVPPFLAARAAPLLLEPLDQRLAHIHDRSMPARRLIRIRPNRRSGESRPHTHANTARSTGVSFRETSPDRGLSSFSVARVAAVTFTIVALVGFKSLASV
jgi:hypothetical protein